jgi:transketolase
LRAAFVQTLVDLAEREPRIVLLTGDLGYLALEPFSNRYAERFFNVGVAEQNLIGLATGLADAGFLPFTYSIATFAAFRPYEFIRNGPIQQQLPVRIVGVGAGFEYSHNGATHFGVDDLGVMRVQPGLTVISPADHEQTRSALRATWDLPGPVYYRLGKDDRATVPDLAGRFTLSRAETVREGRDVLIVAVGAVAIEAVAAADALRQQGVSATVLVISSFNPSPEADIARAASRFQLALTVECHSIVGGIGSLVAEIVAEHGLACRVVRCGVRTTDDGRTGSLEYFYHRHGLSRRSLVATVMSELRDRPA